MVRLDEPPDIKPQWKTLDLIASTEETIHETLRAEGSRTDPPRLRCERTAPDEVQCRAL